MSAAREAVAAICVEGDDIPYRYYGKADEILAALRPIIAAEIRAWAESRRAPGGELHWLVEELGAPEAASGAAIALNNLTASADTIAARITTTGEQQQ